MTGPLDASAPLLAYPDPAEALAGAFPRGAAPAASELWRVGDLVDGRFRLDRLLIRRGGTLTWLAHDETLGRAVLLHLLSPGDPRTPEILDAARAAAGALDSHFLRVLDATQARDPRDGALVVCEYAAGESLELVLRGGPLTPDEACWLVREIADGLVALHLTGLHHRRLNPDTVVVTAAGGVRIVGFPLEAALAPTASDSAPGERADVAALGRLLYACLLGRWPGTAAYGLPAQRLDALGRPTSPRLVAPRLAPEVGQLVDRILNPSATNEPPLETAAEVSAALGPLAATDASAGLASRLRLAEVTDPVTMVPVPPDDAPRSPSTPTEGHGPRVATPVPRPVVAAPDGFGPVRTPPATGQRLVQVLAVLFVAALVFGLSGTFIAQYFASTQAVAHRALPIVGVRDFDPKNDGGDDAENSSLAALAADGQASTAWKTERYGKSADFNGRKPGVGLIVDLGSVKTVASLKVTLVNGATDVELRVPTSTDPAAEPSRATQADWRPVASAPGASGDVTLAPAAAVTTRYVLVYLTKLPAVTGGFRRRPSGADRDLGE